MKVGLQPPGLWSELNKSLEDQFGLTTTKTTVQCFKGVSHALMEICQGLVRSNPHKKKVFAFRDIDPFFSDPLKALAKEGIKVVPLKLDQLEDLASWSEQIDKDALFVLYPKDAPLLGRRHPWQAMAESLNDKRVFQIRVNHESFRTEAFPKEQSPYNLEICAIDNDLAVSFMGQKSRFIPLVAAGLNWKNHSATEIVELLKVKDVDAGKITEFEGLSPGGAQALLADNNQRDWGRAVLCWSDMDGHAVVHELAQVRDLALPDPGESAFFEALSLSRWGGVKTTDWLKALGYSDNQIRGTVIFDEEIIDKSLVDQLKSVHETVLKKQIG